MVDLPEDMRPRTHDEAFDMAERLNYERHRDNHSLRWLRDEIQALGYFDESQIDELMESYS